MLASHNFSGRVGHICLSFLSSGDCVSVYLFFNILSPKPSSLNTFHLQFNKTISRLIQLLVESKTKERKLVGGREQPGLQEYHQPINDHGKANKLGSYIVGIHYRKKKR
jgi:hypothetical protein